MSLEIDAVSKDVLTARWNDVSAKLVQLAEELPADRYEFSPAPEVRTAAAQLRHAAFWNQYLAATLRGESPDGSANELCDEEFAKKDQIVAALRDSFGEVAAAIEASADAEGMAENVISYIGHNSEHYGQLVIYYRLNGLVPPASR
ncbi:MAG TPA: DinB family protein [Longimicrobium sp.]|nr:DinB family protein [Longimicrobium sp.]